MTTAVCKWPATARRWTITPAGNLPTDLTPLGGAQPIEDSANAEFPCTWPSSNITRVWIVEHPRMPLDGAGLFARKLPTANDSHFLILEWLAEALKSVRRLWYGILCKIDDDVSLAASPGEIPRPAMIEILQADRYHRATKLPVKIDRSIGGFGIDHKNLVRSSRLFLYCIYLPWDVISGIPDRYGNRKGQLMVIVNHVSP
jgi:hypothetical protein